MRAAGLHPIVKALASGSHYAGDGEVPAVPGVDGVGDTRGRAAASTLRLPRKPWGTMASAPWRRITRCLPLPDGIDDVQAAAIANPGMSAWLSLKERAGVTAGETVLILGATGVAGQLAIQVGAASRGQARSSPPGATWKRWRPKMWMRVIALAQPEDAIREAFAAEAAQGNRRGDRLPVGPAHRTAAGGAGQGIQRQRDPANAAGGGGRSAGQTITLPGATLRSIDLKMMGSGFGSCRWIISCERFRRCFQWPPRASCTLTWSRCPSPTLRRPGTAWKRDAGSFLRYKPVEELEIQE